MTASGRFSHTYVYADGLNAEETHSMAEQHETPQTPPTDPASGAGTPPTDGQQTPPNSGDERRFTQAELEAIVKDRIAREQRKAEATAAKEREEADASRLKEQGEFQKLAEQKAARVTELEGQLSETETVKQRADRYEAALRKHLDTQRKDLPPHITALLDRLDVDEQLEYLATNHEAIRQPAGASTNGQQRAIPATPKADDGKALTEAERERRAADMARHVRSIF